MKTIIIKTAIAAITVVAGASASQAETVWHFPYKGAPYATQAEPQRNVGVSETKAKRTLQYLHTAKTSHRKHAKAAAQ